MPVISTQGALTVQTIPFTNNQGWYTTSTSSYEFNDFDFSDSGANIQLVASSISSSPRWTYVILNITGNIPNITSSNNYTDSRLGNSQYSKGHGIIYYTSYPVMVGEMYGNVAANNFPIVNATYGYIVTSNNIGFKYYPASTSSSNIYNYRSYNEIVLNKNNNNIYTMGIRTTDPPSSTNSHYISFGQINPTTGLISISSVLLTASRDILKQSDAANTIPGGLACDSANNIICTYNSQLNDPITNLKVGTIGKLNSSYVNQFGICIYHANTSITININKVACDSLDNIYTVVNTDSSYNSYIIKTNSAGALQFCNKISNVKLKCITIDQYNNIYIAGINNATQLYVAQINNVGDIIWQNNLLVSSANFTIKQIKFLNNFLYLAGIQNNYGFILKIPSNGNIPGTGSYGVINYNVSSETIAPSGDLIITYQGIGAGYPGAGFPAIGANANTVTQLQAVTLSSTIIA